VNSSPEAGRPASESEPNFSLAHRDAVREDSWAEYEAAGIKVEKRVVSDSNFDDEYDRAQTYYGVENVYSGDAFDEKEGRPLRHKPGRGIYVLPEGYERFDRHRAEMKAFREAHASSETGPAES
jgi:hypothetical protein